MQSRLVLHLCVAAEVPLREGEALVSQKGSPAQGSSSGKRSSHKNLTINNSGDSGCQ